VRRRYSGGGIASAASQGGGSTSGIWDYGSVAGRASSSPRSGGSTPNYSSASMPSGIWNYGSVADLAGRMPNTGVRQGPSGKVPRQGSAPWAQPERLETWTHHPARARRLSGSPSGSLMQQQNRTGQFAPGYQRPAIPEYWTSSSGNKVYDRPVGQMGPSWARYNGGGVVRRRYQEGGIASLLPQGGGPGAGIPGAGPGAISPVGASDPTLQGDLNAEESYLMNVFQQARLALEGNHPNPDQALSEFVEVFGAEALDKLRGAVGGADADISVPIESDGLSDSIPGNIGGVEEVALSEGEYVVPADAVAAAGNGSTDSGARRMTAMVDDIRRSRGAPGSPNEIEGVGIEEIIRRYGRA